MKNIDQIAQYTINHEWIRKDAPFYTIGMSDFGQTCFKEIERADLPRVGQYFNKGDVFCVLESSKAANEVEMPISGTILQINHQLQQTPDLINQDCYGAGWLVKIVPRNLKEIEGLLSADRYREEIGVFFRKI